MPERLCLGWKGKADPFIPHLLRALTAHLNIGLRASPERALVLSSPCRNAWCRNEDIINYAFLVMLSVRFVMGVTQAKWSGKCQSPPGFRRENLTNSVLSLGQAVGAELCPAAAAGQRAAARTHSQVRKPELRSRRALFSYKIFTSPRFSIARGKAALHGAQTRAGRNRAANTLQNICPQKCPNSTILVNGKPWL